MSSSAPPFAKGLPPAEIIYRREAVEFFQPDLYHDSVAKGRFLYDGLKRSLVPPVVLIPAHAPQLTNWYAIERGTRGLRVCKALSKTLTTEWNVNMEDFEFVTVSSIPGRDAAYINWFNVRQKCLVNYSNFKAYDLNPRFQRLWPSEAVWQSWILAGDRLPSFDPSCLRIIARTAVINLSARRAIWYAARRSTSLVEDPSTGYAVYTKEDDGFYAILGSINGASSMRLLIDHKAELGNRIVDKIIVVGGLPGRRNGVDLDLRDDFTRSRSFLLVLSERRTEEVGYG